MTVRARRLAGWFVRRQGIPEEDAEDLIQQALLVLVLKHREIRSPDAWVIGTLRNKCRRYWRSRRESPVHGLEDEILDAVLPPFPPDQERSDLRRDLEAAIAALPERCRLVLRYRYGLGFRASEIAKLLDCPAANVRKTTSRCLRTLQRQLGMRHVGETSPRPEMG
jgi:RNA polymerase sigma factor (sigma-70 family)